MCIDGSISEGKFVNGCQQGGCKYKDRYGQEYVGKLVSNRRPSDCLLYLDCGINYVASVTCYEGNFGEGKKGRKRAATYIRLRDMKGGGKTTSKTGMVFGGTRMMTSMRETFAKVVVCVINAANGYQTKSCVSQTCISLYL